MRTLFADTQHESATEELDNEAAIETFLAAWPERDSLFGVTPMQTRLWCGDGTAVNHNPAVLERTQNLRRCMRRTPTSTSSAARHSPHARTASVSGPSSSASIASRRGTSMKRRTSRLRVSCWKRLFRMEPDGDPSCAHRLPAFAAQPCGDLPRFAELGIEVEAPEVDQQLSEEYLLANIHRFDGVVAGDRTLHAGRARPRRPPQGARQVGYRHRWH